MNKLYIKKQLFLSTLLFALLASVFFLSCRKNDSQYKILVPGADYERIKQEFYNQFTYYDLTGDIFSIDWHQPEIYSVNKIQYTVFSIIEKGRCQDCGNTKEDELPVYKLVIRNNLKTGKIEMFFYKITPSVKFLRSGKKLGKIKWDHDQFRGFKEVFDLKGKLLSKDYVNGLNVITDRDSYSGFKYLMLLNLAKKFRFIRTQEYVPILATN